MIKGPPGSGKTATLSVMARALDFDIVEWKDPTGTEYTSENFISLGAQFEDFLERNQRYPSLMLESSRTSTKSSKQSSSASIVLQSARRKVIMIEEFPNTFVSGSPNLVSFKSSISRLLKTTTSLKGTSIATTQATLSNFTPVVLIISEVLVRSSTAASDSFTAHRLLGADLLHHPGLRVVEFNPIAPTILIKALNLVLRKDTNVSRRKRAVEPRVLARLSEIGDVRSAIGSLEFICVNGDRTSGWSENAISSKGRRPIKSTRATEMQRESMAVIAQRGVTLDLFHAVGKVVYNKRETIPAPRSTAVQSQDQSPQIIRCSDSEASVDRLFDETGSDTMSFVAALHENYVLSCAGVDFIEAANGCIDALSDCDLLASNNFDGAAYSLTFRYNYLRGNATETLAHSDMCFHIAVRGLRSALPVTVNRRSAPSSKDPNGRDSFKMYYPMSMRLWKEAEEVESLVKKWVDAALRGISWMDHIATNQPETPREVKSATFSSQMSPSLASWNSNPPLLVGCIAVQTEVILERLPYYAKIKLHGLTSVMREELQEMTQFHRINSATKGTMLTTRGDLMTTLHSLNDESVRSPPTHRGDIKLDSDMSSAIFSELIEAKFMLSDDEIEDD